MTEIGIIFERVKIVPRVIEIIKSIARYSEICLGIYFKSEIEVSGCQCMHQKLYSVLKTSIRCKMCKENYHLLSLKWTEHMVAFLQVLLVSFRRLYKMDREETHVQVFQKLSYFMVSYVLRFRFWAKVVSNIDIKHHQVSQLDRRWTSPSSSLLPAKAKWRTKFVKSGFGCFQK